MTQDTPKQQDICQTILLERTSDIVAAYVSNNSLPADDLPALILSVYQAMEDTTRVGTGPIGEKPIPAVPVDQSVSDTDIVCLEDGKKYKSLKRHLRTSHGMTPKDYIQKWGLPPDYPMVAPSYSKQRSSLAKRTGLGKA